MKFIRKVTKKEEPALNSKDAAKERLHLVLMQDRANVSADFLELMKQEIIEVIKKYIEIDETSIDVRLTNKDNGDGTKGAPALYANIPITNIKDEVRQNSKTNTDKEEKTNSTEKKIESTKEENKAKKVKEEKQEFVEDDKEDKPEEIEQPEEPSHEEENEEVVAQNNKK